MERNEAARRAQWAQAERDDAEARRVAQREFAKPLALEAGAGTGKTAALVARIAAWCVGPGWQLAISRSRGRGPYGGGPARGETETDAGDTLALAGDVLGRVVAITFTEKAAAEMAERVAEALGALEAGAPVVGLEPLGEPVVVQRRAQALLALSDRLRVMTIHSFCRSVLSAHPLEAGLHPAFEVDATGSAAAEVAEAAVSELLPELLRELNSPGGRLLQAGLGPHQWLSCVQGLLLRDVQVEALLERPFSDERLAPLFAEFAGAASALVEAAAPLRSGKGQLRKAIEAVDSVEVAGRTALGPAPVLERLSKLRGDFGPAQERLDAWAQGKFTATEAKAFGPDAEPAVRLASVNLIGVARGLMRCDPMLQDALDVMVPLVQAGQRALQSRGSVSFDALLARARRLLETRPDVAATVREGIDLLLVDEFQDTDPTQCAIVRALALPPGEVNHRPALFVVGDPKQSIYGWRSADLAAYQAFVASMLDAGGEQRSLVVNFRSVPQVLDEVELALGTLMGPRDTPLSPRFQTLVPSKQNAERAPYDFGGRAPVEHWCAYEVAGAAVAQKDTGSGRARELEAEAIAADLAALRQAGRLESESAAILLRTMSDVNVYLDALRRAGVPYAVQRDPEYYRRREVVDAISLVAAALDPTDQLSLVGWLRSPAVGVPDAAWLPLWEHDFPALAAALGQPDDTDADDIGADDKNTHEADTETLFAIKIALDAAAIRVSQAPEGFGPLIAGWQSSALWALRALGILRRMARSAPADLWVDALRALMLPEPTEAGRFLGLHRLANLERLWRELERSLTGEHVVAADLLNDLRNKLRGGDPDAGGASPAEPGAVQVLSIHKSKGLAWHHVYLGNLHGRPRGDDAAPALEMAETPGGLEMSLMGLRSPGFEQVTTRKRLVRAGEQMRTLYVALTRARLRLVTCGQWMPYEDIHPESARSYAELLAPRSAFRDFLESWSSACESVESGDAAEGRVAPSQFVWVDDSGAQWRWAASPISEAPDQRPDSPSLMTDGLAARRARVAAELRANWQQEADARQARRLLWAPSSVAHEAMVEAEVGLAATQESTRLADLDTDLNGDFHANPLAGEDDGERGPWRAPLKGTPAVAKAVGTLVHRALELWDPLAVPAAETIRLSQAAHEWLAQSSAALSREERQTAGHAVANLIERFAAGPLARRLAEVKIIARELPYCAAPDTGDPGAETGAIDLVYSDPKTSDVVVVDFKTDSVAGELLAERARLYAPQAKAYAQAVQRGLRLPISPRAELWFVAAGQIVDVSRTAL